MNDELVLIRRMMNSMEDIINATPGERFTITDGDTLVILQRRMEASDLKNALGEYNQVFMKNEGAEIDDIAKSAVAMVKVRTLVEAETENFNARLTRQLIKEYKAQISRVINIIKLSKINAMSAADYEKEAIEITAAKNEAFLDRFEKEIVDLEKQIERMPQVEEEEKPEKKEVKNVAKPEVKRTSLVDRMKSVVEKRKNQKDIGEELRMVEAKSSKTKCVEIPFYDKTLYFNECHPCKDMPEYSLMKRKNDIFFGLTRNISAKSYNNSDHSLLELTKATEDFCQYMTEDLLSGEYCLLPYREIDKASLAMYFDFVSVCFGEYIGKTLSIQEYLKFKEYYNRILMEMFHLEAGFKAKYYQALMLADRYMDYMSGYDLEIPDDREQIVENLIDKNGHRYIRDLDLIRENHVISMDSLDDIHNLIIEINGFIKEEEPQVNTEDAWNETIDVPIKIQIVGEDGAIEDEATFVGTNLLSAVSGYMKQSAYIKKLGVIIDGKEEYLFIARNGLVPVALLNPEDEGEVLRGYEKSILRTMIHLTGEDK